MRMRFRSQRSPMVFGLGVFLIRGRCWNGHTTVVLRVGPFHLFLDVIR